MDPVRHGPWTRLPQTPPELLAKPNRFLLPPPRRRFFLRLFRLPSPNRTPLLQDSSFCSLRIHRDTGSTVEQPLTPSPLYSTPRRHRASLSDHAFFLLHSSRALQWRSVQDLILSPVWKNNNTAAAFCELVALKKKGRRKSQISSMDKTANVVLDIEGLPQPPDKCCSGSPKMTRALSRKGSNRLERRGSEEQDQEDLGKKLIIKVVPSQLEQPLVQNKTMAGSHCASSTPVFMDSVEGRSKRFNRLTSINPRRILLFFATLSSVGTTILIYFTLAINSKAEA